MTERARSTCCFGLPRRARVAIGPLHRNMRHLPNEVLLQVLRAARAPQDFVNAAKYFRCQGCDNTEQIPQRTKCHHFVLNYAITKLASTCLECSMRLADVSRFRKLFAWEPHVVKPGSRVSPSLSALHPPVSAPRLLSMADSLRQRDTHWRSMWPDAFQEWCDSPTFRTGVTRTKRKSRTTMRHAQTCDDKR